MTVYLVTGPRAYREHKPGSTFEATLPSDVEARAVAHGAISVVERNSVTLRPGTWKVPTRSGSQPQQEDKHDE